MSKKRGLFWIVIIIFFLISQSYAAETIRIATLNWEPYIGQQLTNEGVMAEITREAFKRLGYMVEYNYLPWKRAVVMAEKGEYDGYFPAYWSKQREEKSIFTEVILSGPVGFFKIKKHIISFNKLEDLIPYRIGIVHGFVNTPAFDAADYLKKEVVTTDLQNIQKLLKHRVDLIVADKFVGFYLINKFIPHMKGQIEFIFPPLQNKELYICMSKKTKNVNEKVKAFNKGLKEIKKDGTFANILQKYKF
ncbi:MAG: transporter substrate-binding domain-containing protein [Desulfobacteraceae bacterium]|nr:transporter substrate-binding domain-containing protein [Desulfobacteraceae bacterium]